jgi:hypothetical protein
VLPSFELGRIYRYIWQEISSFCKKIHRILKKKVT